MTRRLTEKDVPAGSIMAWLLKPRGVKQSKYVRPPRVVRHKYTREQRERGIV